MENEKEKREKYKKRNWQFTVENIVLKIISKEMNCMPADVWGEIKNLPGNDVSCCSFC